MIKPTPQKYACWYGRLLRLYPDRYREQFGEPMMQTFQDLLSRREESGKGLIAWVFWVYVETSIEIVRENLSCNRKYIKGIFIRTAVVALSILSLPLVAMQFTSEVQWGWADFFVAGVLLFGTGLAYELMVKKFTFSEYRIAIGIAFGTALLLVWMNLAVGIIGNEDNPANLMFVGVLGIGVIGAFVSRLQPSGMARTLIAMSIAQMMVAVIVLVFGMDSALVLNGFFATLWMVSALLFWQQSVHSQKIQ